MIVILVIGLIMPIVSFLIELLPATTLESVVNTGFLNLLSNGVYILGRDNFVMIITSVVGWTVAHISWAVIEWIYKKIPGVS